MTRASSLPNDEYWRFRANLRMARIESGTVPYLENINRAIEEVSAQLEGDIEKILTRYMKTGQLEREAALMLLREPISEAELEAIRLTISNIKDKRVKAVLMAKLNAPAYRARIERLEALRLSARARLASMAESQLAQTETALKGAANEAFMRTIFDVQKGTGVGFGFAQATEAQVEEVLKQKWAGDHYSSRIWNNADEIAQRLPDIIQRNMLTGRSWQRCTGEVADLVKNGGLYSAERVLRTETAYVANEMEAQAYEESGLDKYRYVATLDSRTSETCQEHDGKVYELAKREPGTNYPPLHPNCRSTTVADFGDEELAGMERRARDPETGKNVLIPAETTYKQWEDGLTSDGRGALQFNRKAAENKAADALQFARYRAELGGKAPSNLQDFQTLKYRNPEEFRKRQAYIKDKRGRKFKMPPELTYPVWHENMYGKTWTPIGFSPDHDKHHLGKHVADYPGMTLEEYNARAKQLLTAPLGGGLEGFISALGNRFRYDVTANDFVMAQANGMISSMYKPVDGYVYWLGQIEEHGGGGRIG